MNSNGRAGLYCHAGSAVQEPWTVYLGKDAHEAVHNAVVLEEVAKMAARCEMINPKNVPAPQELQDKHYYRKHGANAYYGQPGK